MNASWLESCFMEPYLWKCYSFQNSCISKLHCICKLLTNAFKCTCLLWLFPNASVLIMGNGSGNSGIISESSLSKIFRAAGFYPCPIVTGGSLLAWSTLKPYVSQHTIPLFHASNYQFK